MNWIKRLLGFIYGVMRTSYYERRYQNYKHTYGIKSSFGFNGTDIRIYGDGDLLLGDESYIGSLSTIQLTKGYKVSIGRYCSISHNVRIYTATAISDQDFICDQKVTKFGDVIIGDGVWIGANVFINPGIVIENNSIIGANSVVTKDVKENSIVGGTPARLIRKKKI